jgi:bifunctional DNase/RNase
VIEIDSRPSDALAIAVRAHVPILVAKEVMDTAGIVPEQDVQQNPESASPSASSGAANQPAAEPSEERLSVFEDFLQNLDLGDGGNDEPEDQDDEDEGKSPDKG